MAIQAQMYPDNFGLPLMGGSQDWLFMSNNNQNNFNNLSNTNNTTNNMVYNGCGFNDFTCSNNLQQQKQQEEEVMLQLQQQHLLQLQNQQQRNSCVNNNNNNDGFVFMSSSKNNCTSTTTASTTTTTTGSDYNQMQMSFSPSFVDQLEKQRQEIDRFITLQNERLKLALQEQRKQQLSTIMRRLEDTTMQLLTQKDDEILRATKRTIELEDIITNMEIENKEWQRLATENEAMVVSLNNTLEQLKQQTCCINSLSSSCSSNDVDDVESCCNVDFGVVNNEEVLSNKIGKQETKDGVVLCKVCKNGNLCMLLLPCRHLCCCKGCEPFVDACPVCKAAKMASIEALIS